MRKDFIKKGQSINIELNKKQVSPVCVSRFKKDDSFYRGYGVVKEKDFTGSDVIDDYLMYDFGEHYVGHLSFDISGIDEICDSPVKLRFHFAEVPYEFTDCPESRTGWLSYSWIQEEIIHVDYLPSHVELPRRYAFRYVKIEVLAKNKIMKVVISNPRVTAETSGDFEKYDIVKNPRWKKVGEVCVRTLRDCMQTFFEDGPKRDRRLWLGDMRLQALVNYDTFKNYDLVKKCMYLFAGLTGESGIIPSCIYEFPKPMHGKIELYDFALSFAATLCDYYDATNDRETAEELFEPAYSQYLLFEKLLDENYLINPPEGWWCHIDWGKDFPKLLCMEALAIYFSGYMIDLAVKLSKNKEAEHIKELRKNLFDAVTRTYYNAETGLFEEEGKVMWVPNIYLIDSGLIPKEQGVKMIYALRECKDAVFAITPSCHHYMLEAFAKLGLYDLLGEHIDAYWGGMLRDGADTFWETYDINDPFVAAYDDVNLTSYCHAWSTTPIYFILRYLDK